LTLILPKKYLDNKKEFSDEMRKQFYKDLENFINQHSEVRGPYYILYRCNFSDANWIKRKNESQENSKEEKREAFGFYQETRPPLIKNSMVFIMDNSWGEYFHLWTIPSDGNCRFNMQARDKLQEKYGKG